MITDGNVRYRYTVNKVRAIGVYVVNKSIVEQVTRVGCVIN